MTHDVLWNLSSLPFILFNFFVLFFLNIHKYALLYYVSPFFNIPQDDSKHRKCLLMTPSKHRTMNLAKSIGNVSLRAQRGVNRKKEEVGVAFFFSQQKKWNKKLIKS